MNKKRILKKVKYSLRFLPDKMYLQLHYFIKFKRFINFKDPKTFNEKINWLKIHDRNPEYTKMVDKYEAKEYVKNIIGEKYIIPTIGVWDKFEDIDFQKLPDQFVLKCTHDSEGLVIVKDKSKLDIREAKKKIEEAMRYNFFYIGREYPYKNIKPRIIAEPYLEDSTNHELRDYKFFCFNGKVEIYKIDFNRQTKHQANYYDRKGNLLKFGEVICPPDYNKKIKKPEKLKLMIKLAEQLSSDDCFVRIDFYQVNGQVFFGEKTFYPASGFGKFTDPKWDYNLGKLMII